MNQQIKLGALLLFSTIAVLTGCKEEKKDRITIDITSKEVSGYGETVVVYVQSNTFWFVSSDKSWAEPSFVSSEKNDTVYITIAPNSTRKRDQAVILFKAGDASTKLTIYRDEPLYDVYKIGDLYPNAENPIGVVFEIVSPGLQGKIMSLDEAKNLTWGSAAPTYANNMDNGLVNWQTIRSINTTLDNFPAFAWCNSHNNNTHWNTWYLPSYREMNAITENVNVINTSLQKIPAAVPLKEKLYWSSTESAAAPNKVFAVPLSAVSMFEIEKDSLCAVRAVTTF